MNRRPPRVYLDSSDFSVLSDPTKRTVEIAAIRAQLLNWAASGEVEFRYSGVHLSEASPLERDHLEAAEQRAELLANICGTQALISIDRLLRYELASLMGGGSPVVTPYSDTGDWFPSVSNLVSPILLADTIKDIKNTAGQLAANRWQRRALEKQHFKGNRLRSRAQKQLLSQQDSGLSEILRLYPMREQDAKVLSAYILGRATAAQAEDAFLASLRDPRWMMKWFDEHSEQLSPVIQWVRKSGQELRDRVCEAKEVAERLRALASLGGSTNNVLGFGPESKLGLRQSILSRLIIMDADDASEARTDDVEDKLRDVPKHAPGLHVAVTAMVESFLKSLGPQPRTPKHSDLPDVFHALYAPYVDVFRADAYMALLIKAALPTQCDTIVVGKLTHLVPTITSLLEERGRS